MNQRKRWVAHCLDFDIVATADDFHEAESRLDTLVKRHIERFLRSNGACPTDAAAPEVFWTRWTECIQHANCVLPTRSLTVEVPAPVPMKTPFGEVKVLEARAA